jgi:glycopeptide antibiotics resistance protein
VEAERKRWIAAGALIAYGAVLIRFVVFKAIPVLHVGHLRFKFGGQRTGAANFVPFKTIGTFLNGRGNHLIAMVNVVGNIVLFVPVGLLAPLVFRRMTWKTALVLAVAVGLAMEGMEAVFRVGIFDVDDILLNGFGVMIGYWLFAMFSGGVRPRMRSSQVAGEM